MRNIRRLASILVALLIVTIGGTVAYAMNANIKKLPVTIYLPQDQTNAVWDWTNPSAWRSKQLPETAQQLRRHQINTVYVDIGSLVVDAPASPATTTQELEKQKKLYSDCEYYIKQMNKQGVKVYAAAGDTDWSKPEQQAIPQRIQQFVYEYNSSHKATFSGIEFDIESYNQEGFADASFTEKSLVLNEYMDMVDKIATNHEAYIKQSGNRSMGLGFAIPYWYDNQNGNIKSINWHEKTGPVLFHLLDRLNKLPTANVVVMAYRYAAVGNDGIMYHARTEVDYAQSKANKVNVIIGIETTNVEPAKITFYGKTKTELSNEVETIQREFTRTGVYGGIGINDLQGYLSMKE